MAKKALLVLLLAIFALVSSAGSLLAQSTTTPVAGTGIAIQTDQRLIEQYTNATKQCVEPSLECLVFYTTNYVAIQLTNSIVPIDGAGVKPEGDGSSIEKGINVTQNQGIVPGLAYFIGAMYANPAANTHTYVADLLEGANIATPARAQGLGYGSLNPILEIWKMMRNVAYLFYVIMFIVIGILIMLRKRVGQAAITAQQAIPSAIVSLIFVTFSYAIAGFLIDIMYLSMFLIIGLFQTQFDSNPDIINYNIIELMATFIDTGSIAGFDIGYNVVESIITSVVGGSNFLSGAAGWIGGITIGLVIAIAVLIGMFKLFFELLRSYATIVLSVVVGPLQLMLGAIPGNDTVTPWIKNLIANLAAFPTVLVVAAMFYVFTSDVMQARTDGGFMPPYLIGRGASGAIATLMGLAILLAMPEIVKEVKKKLGATEGFGKVIADAAMDRSKAAWKGDGVPGGLGARRLLGAGGIAATVPVTTAGGALVGGAISKSRGGSFRSGAKIGGLTGAVAPLAAPILPRIAKEAYNIGSSEVKQLIATETVDRGLHKLSSRQGRIGEAAKRKLAERLLSRVGRQPQSVVDKISSGDPSDGL